MFGCGIDVEEFEMILRKETLADIEVITEVTIAAFKDHPISRQRVKRLHS